MDENQWNRRFSAIATNAVLSAMQKHQRSLMTDEDAARRDAIYELLKVSPANVTEVPTVVPSMQSAVSPELDKALTELMASIPSKPNG